MTVVRSSEETSKYLQHIFLCLHLVSNRAPVVFSMGYYCLFPLIIIFTVVRSRDSSVAITTRLRTRLK